MIDKTILKSLFDQHHDEMIHLAKTMLYTDEEVEDVVQDVFLRLMENGKISTDNKIRAYLMTAVRNGCINKIKQKSLKERVLNLYSVEIEIDWTNVEERMEMLDTIMTFAESQMTEPHKTIFRLRFQEGLTVKDIANQLGMNLKTVYKYLCQSIQDVQKKVKH